MKIITKKIKNNRAETSTSFLFVIISLTLLIVGIYIGVNFDGIDNQRFTRKNYIPKKRNNNKNDVKSDPIWLEYWTSKGQKEYNACASCHGPNGQGVGKIPPLSKSEWVVNDPTLLVNVVLKGLKGEITVNGKKYNEDGMNGFGDVMSSEQIAQVLTFVRRSFNNDASAITEQFVNYVKRKVESKTTQFSPAELQVLLNSNDKLDPFLPSNWKVVTMSKFPKNAKE